MHVHLCECVCMYICVCVCVYMHVHLCVCSVCVFARAYLGLRIGFQSQQAADLLGLGLDDSGTHIVLWVRIHILQQGCPQAQQLETREGGWGREKMGGSRMW